MHTDKNPYEILGVRQGASQDDIRNAYLKLAKKYHPDQYRNHPLEDVAQSKMQEINFAYDYLTRHDGSTQSSSASNSNANANYGGGNPFGDQGQNANQSQYTNQNQNQNQYKFTNQGQNPFNWGQNNNDPNNRNFYNYNRRAGQTGGCCSGGCCQDLCLCFAMDSCCECMGGDLCSCC